MATFSSFRAYDDEGYYLANLNDYLSGHPLLTSYAQVYGPFFYEFYGGLFKVFGLTPDNDTARLLTAIAWLVASAMSGLVAWRLTRNLWLGVAAELLTFSLLSALTNEPMGTYAIVSLLLLGVVWAAIGRPARPRAAAVSIGAMVAAACLIKINIGGLAAAAVVFAWAAGLAPRPRRLVLPAVTVVTAVLPFVLMSSLLTQVWVFSLGAVVALGVAAIGVAGLARPAQPTPHSVPWFGAGGTIVAALSIGVALAGGTRFGDLWNGLVVAPLRFPELFTVPVSVGPIHVVVAAVSCGAAIAAAARHAAISGLVRVAAGFFMVLSLIWMPNAIFMAALPLAWIATQAPPGVDDPVGAYGRALLPPLAVLQTLQVYPIAGTQASMAGLSLIPVAAIILGDGLRLLASGEVRSARLVAPSAVFINVAVVLILALTATAAFASGVPLGVRGAEHVRLPAQQSAEIRRLVAAIDQDCASFVTFPGMNSLYIWTAEDPPTPVRVEIWWLVLDDGQQASLVQQLSAKPRLCAVKNEHVIQMWSAGRQVPEGPLVDFIDRSFVHQGSYGDYELLVSAST